jgi:hypothetical protein
MEPKPLCLWTRRMLHLAESGGVQHIKHYRWHTWRHSTLPAFTNSSQSSSCAAHSFTDTSKPTPIHNRQENSKFSLNLYFTHLKTPYYCKVPKHRSRSKWRLCCYCFTNSLVRHVVVTSVREMKPSLIWWLSNYGVIYRESWCNRWSDWTHTQTHTITIFYNKIFKKYILVSFFHWKHVT